MPKIHIELLTKRIKGGPLGIGSLVNGNRYMR